MREIRLWRPPEVVMTIDDRTAPLSARRVLSGQRQGRSGHCHLLHEQSSIDDHCVLPQVFYFYELCSWKVCRVAWTHPPSERLCAFSYSTPRALRQRSCYP